MSHDCVTNKVCHKSREEALEALTETHLTRRIAVGLGPVNVYLCNDCGNWHLTSQGEVNPILKSAEFRNKLEKWDQSQFWTDRFK